MKIRTNKKMNRSLGLRGHDFTMQTVALPSELEQLIESGFRIENECVLLKDFDNFGSGPLNSDFKKTEYEDFLNNIHIDDYTSTVDEFNYLKIGLEFSKRLYNKLREDYRMSFRITISFRETAYVQQEIETHGGCMVKFYMVRPSCDDKFRVDNLDKFESEGVLVIE